MRVKTKDEFIQSGYIESPKGTLLAPAIDMSDCTPEALTFANTLSPQIVELVVKDGWRYIDGEGVDANWFING